MLLDAVQAGFDPASESPRALFLQGLSLLLQYPQFILHGGQLSRIAPSGRLGQDALEVSHAPFDRTLPDGDELMARVVFVDDSAHDRLDGEFRHQRTDCAVRSGLVDQGKILLGIRRRRSRGTFFFCGEGGEKRPVLYADSAERAALIALGLPELLQLLLVAPWWRDCQAFTAEGR